MREPRMPLLLALLALLPVAWTQAQCPCCGNMLETVSNACGSVSETYQGLVCDHWEQEVQERCEFDCTNCTDMTHTFFDACYQTIYDVTGDEEESKGECEVQFKTLGTVCDDKCELKDKFCNTEEGAYCMAECGTYIPCTCFKQSGSVKWECRGQVVNSDNMESCYDLVDTREPATVLNLCYKVDSRCQKYRTCPIDFCALQNITCPPVNQCYNEGTCDPDTGKCWWSARRNGAICDDRNEFTNNDRCITSEGGGSSSCAGDLDYCRFLGISCESPTDCLLDGECHAESGVCVFSPKPDGTECNDDTPWTYNDRCLGGLCVGQENASGLCKACPEALEDKCMVGGYTCDPHVGDCTRERAPDDTDCSEVTCRGENADGSGDQVCATSSYSRCLNGQCVTGIDPTSAYYKYYGEFDNGVVKDLPEGVEVEKGSLPPPPGSLAFHRDVPTMDECQQHCTADVQCVGFGYSMTTTVCILYGEIRTHIGESMEGWVKMFPVDCNGQVFTKQETEVVVVTPFNPYFLFVGPFGVTLCLMITGGAQLSYMWGKRRMQLRRKAARRKKRKDDKRLAHAHQALRGRNSKAGSYRSGPRSAAGESAVSWADHPHRHHRALDETSPKPHALEDRSPFLRGSKDSKRQTLAPAPDEAEPAKRKTLIGRLTGNFSGFFGRKSVIQPPPEEEEAEDSSDEESEDEARTPPPEEDVVVEEVEELPKEEVKKKSLKKQVTVGKSNETPAEYAARIAAKYKK